MAATRRKLLQTIAGTASVVGLAGLAGCSSSCPDSDPPTPEETISILADTRGPFETTPSGVWNGFAGDVGNTGYAGRSLPDGDLVVRWRIDLALPDTDAGSLSASAPTVGEGLVLVADERRVHAHSLRSGDRRWATDEVSPTTDDAIAEYRSNTVAPVFGPAGTVLVGATDGLVALDPSDGSVRWRIGNMTRVSRPAVLDGTIIALGTERLVAIAPDGTEQWRRPANRLSAPVPPAAGDDRIVYPSGDGVVARDVERGSQTWVRDRQTETQLVVDDGTAVLGNDEGLHAIELDTGDPLWTFSRGEFRALLSPVVTPENIYAVEQPGEAGAATFALDRTDREPTPRWCSYVGSGAVTAATDDLALTTMSLGSGPDRAQSIVAFTAELGASPWAIEGGSHPRAWVTPPAIVAGAIVVTTRGGTVVAIGGAD
ncbi:WD40/PQQ-like beta propeller repeat containing protein [Halanaeroarchaeum sp. HSR-CO]|uniref:outer membrane protein assembly factor BamB family protein n=1 Tax=Halanaeroarchaeum sp. HSR-CO TaxID=2866382 RepID=UPI00217E1D5B|nr:PQQ-binding-like beta-propeller repeat protein [Halanaeroarchaeum sp. HSR-CO]UWG48602.1 WD40/PQQ-like beta propeller repeat containing protein [Halanaeroarchaeum sp. HSR-CO]